MTNNNEVALFYIDAANADLSAPTFAESGIEVTLVCKCDKANLDAVVLNDFKDNYVVEAPEAEDEEVEQSAASDDSAKLFRDLGLRGVDKVFPEIAADLITKSLIFFGDVQAFENEYSKLLDEVSAAMDYHDQVKALEEGREEVEANEPIVSAARLVRSKQFAAYAIANHRSTTFSNIQAGNFDEFVVKEGYLAFPTEVLLGSSLQGINEQVFKAWNIIGSFTYAEDNDTVAVKVEDGIEDEDQGCHCCEGCSSNCGD